MIAVLASTAIAIAVPSTDGARGTQLGLEHFFPQFHASLVWTVEARETATGDYTGLRAGGGLGWRVYFPDNRMHGWFIGSAGFGALDATRARQDHRWLGTALELGVTFQLGYRFTPWRGLAITPSVGWEMHHDFAARLPDWSRVGATVGLDLGWQF